MFLVQAARAEAIVLRCGRPSVPPWVLSGRGRVFRVRASRRWGSRLAQGDAASPLRDLRLRVCVEKNFFLSQRDSMKLCLSSKDVQRM